MATARTLRHDGDNHIRLAAGDGGDGDALDQWAASLSQRVALQAEVIWPALHDGYATAGGEDPARPFDQLWWQLQPVKTDHCPDCPWVAYNSPYDPPGSGGNELAQTPGDGATECGAACHCTLSYGGWELPQDADWVQYMIPPDAPMRNPQPSAGVIPSTVREQDWSAAGAFGSMPIGVDAEGNYVYAGTPEEAGLAARRGPALYGTVREGAGALPSDAITVRSVAADAPALTSKQQQALDAFRSAWARWNRVRGGWSSARSLFGYVWDESRRAFVRPSATAGLLVPRRDLGFQVQAGASGLGPNGERFATSWSELTPAQQRAMVDLYGAIVAWNDATQAAAAGDDSQQFTEDGESITLYSPDQPRNRGKFTYWHGQQPHGGGGQRGHEAGNPHGIEEHLGAHAAAAISHGGGGGASTAEEAKSAKSAKPRAARAAKPKTAKAEAKAETEQPRTVGVVRHIPAEQIHVGLNPREHFDPEKIAELAQSIKEHGLLQPISVRPHEGGYQIIAGERRFRALQSLGAEHIPAIVHNVSDAQARELALIENVVRADMRPIETAKAYAGLRENGLTVKQISERTGKSVAHIQQHLDLLTLQPHIQKLVDEGRLHSSIVRDLAKLSPAGQEEAANHILTKDLGVKSAKATIKAIAAREAQVEMFPRSTGQATKAQMDARVKYEEAVTRIAQLMHGLDDETMGHYAQVVEAPARESQRLDLMVKQLRRMQKILEYAHAHRQTIGMSEAGFAWMVESLNVEVRRLAEAIDDGVIRLTGGHPPGYDEQGHDAKTGHWLPGKGREHESASGGGGGRHAEAGERHGGGAGPARPRTYTGANLAPARRAEQEQHLAHERMQLVKVEAAVREHDGWLRSHEATHPDYARISDQRLRLASHYETLQERIAAREQLLGHPVTAKREIEPTAPATVRRVPGGIVKQVRPEDLAWRAKHGKMIKGEPAEVAQRESERKRIAAYRAAHPEVEEGRRAQNREAAAARRAADRAREKTDEEIEQQRKANRDRQAKWRVAHPEQSVASVQAYQQRKRNGQGGNGNDGEQLSETTAAVTELPWQEAWNLAELDADDEVAILLGDAGGSDEDRVLSVTLAGGHEPGYSQNRDNKGRWAPGDGGRQQSGHEAGGTRGIHEHVGAAHAETSHGGGGGGGGGGRASMAAHTDTAKVTYEDPQAHQTARRVFGRDLADHEVAALVGARAGDHILVMHSDKHELALEVTGANHSFTAQRTVHGFEDGSIVLRNEYIKVADAYAGQGLGAEILARQVSGAARMGVGRIETTAARSGSMNGYYTWARLGYDGPIPQSMKVDFPQLKELAPHGTMHELMRVARITVPANGREVSGAELWKSRGQTWHGTFDLTPGSRSRQILRAYLEEKGRKSLADELQLREPGAGESRGEEIEWTAEDEAAADRAWRKLDELWSREEAEQRGHEEAES